MKPFFLASTMMTLAGAASSQTITPGHGALTDATGNAWTITQSGSIMEGRQYTPGGGQTSALTIIGGKVYGEDSTGRGWFSLSSDNQYWSSMPTPPPGVPAASAPSSTTVVQQAAGSPTVAAPAPCGAVANGAPTGGFSTANGQIYAPDGKPFIAKGINVSQQDEPPVGTLQAAFPAINFVRFVVSDLSNPASLTAYVNDLTSHGLVVEIEHHVGSGGGVPPLSGGALAAENAWFGSLASTFKNNPNVWFGTLNEPSDTAGNAGVLAAEQASNYATIRGAGNNAIIMLSAGLGPPPVSTSAMTNVAVDQHYYGWVSGYSTDQATVTQSLNNLISADQQLATATGKIPLLIGEYGNSTTGATIDPNGDQVIAAVQGSGYGSAAWEWGTGAPGDGLTNSGGTASSYGQQVAGYIALVANAPASIWACSGQTAAASAHALVAQANTASVQTAQQDMAARAQQSAGGASQTSGQTGQPSSQTNAQNDTVAAATAASVLATSAASDAVDAAVKQAQAIQAQIGRFNAGSNPGVRAVAAGGGQ